MRIFITALLATGVVLSDAQASHSAEGADDVANVSASQRYADQGAAWTAARRQSFHSEDQGSRIMPTAWLRALKTHDGSDFLHDGLARFGYLIDFDTEANGASEFPIGMVSAPYGMGQAYLATTEGIGLTCAACHTRDLRYRDELIRIDGAPSMADFGAFLIELFEAVNETLADEARFTQFASDVLNGGYPVNSADDLREEVMAWNAYEGELLALSLGLHTGTKVDWGAGRMDALQMIFNRISGMYASPIAGELLTSNIKLADSPTRPPFLWDTDKQDRSQWTGFAENHTEDLHLGRNYGQVLGVFANLTVSKDPTFPTAFSLDYTSQNSANLEGLVKLEKSGVKKIGPPKWPWTGDHPQAIDVKKAARGKIIFGRTPQEGECFKCHGEQRSRLEYFKGNELTGYWQTPILFTAKATQDPTTGEPGIVPDSTDTRQCDVISSVKSLVDTGIFEGELVQGKRVGDDQCWGNKFPEKLPSTLMLKWVVQNATGQTNERRFQTSLPAIIEAGKACELPQAPPLPEGACAYESRVLSGIWASAPYLHNGSVGSLRELLEKPEARKNSFAIGTHFDPNTVGLSVDQPEGSYVLETTGCATNEERNSGNSNCGHDYGTDLSTLQKLDLLEYLKTL